MSDTNTIELSGTNFTNVETIDAAGGNDTVTATAGDRSYVGEVNPRELNCIGEVNPRKLDRIGITQGKCLISC